jgi:hypothetical protein
MRCYAQASKRRDRMAKPHRKAFDQAVEWAAMGSNEPIALPAPSSTKTQATKNPRLEAVAQSLGGVGGGQGGGPRLGEALGCRDASAPLLGGRRD